MSQVGNLRRVAVRRRYLPIPRNDSARSADYQSAIQQIINLRYDVDARREHGDLNRVKWITKAKAAIGLNLLPAPLRKLIVAVIGLTILLIGVAMVVLPGPAFIVIPVGLAILATEFAWARRVRFDAPE